MGQATFQSDLIPATGQSHNIINEAIELSGQPYKITCVNVGNPHCVIFTDHLSVDEVKEIGAQLENHPMFPQRINVQWVKVLGNHSIQIEIWERGAGYTFASGTSSCATACASIAHNLCQSPIEVKMRGGTAIVEVDEAWHIQLTGSVQAIASGIFANDFLSQLV